MKSYALLTLLAAAASATNHLPAEHAAAAAMTHTVTVGGVQPPADPTGTPTPMFVYSPESIQAAVGDTVHFIFMQKNHSVTQSTFAKPCVKLPEGIDSGLLPNPDGAAGVTFDLQVGTTEPIWFYCKQRTGNHCGKGMVFAINAVESSEKSFAAYKQLAIAQNGTELQSAAIVAPGATAAPSTVSLNVEAAPTQTHATQVFSDISPSASVVPGTGVDAAGQECQCSCLCGTNSFPDGTGMHNFGGFSGKMKISY
ncbi:hypothetical protein M501DRAFT_930681 [Patellaria atrata CBS 101060]|uniref:Cupredoxin n=1 Tax=Patellaria atrata CBS 101060 TaxID=1346257 RepID=A0A9P4SDT6_9PEZI|nr:hypothetical protein M501DRAFT_930681 [Patellaria atrata CBS 101060]